jgi:hypothetical protein
MWICSLPLAFSTSMLCKERGTIAWRSRNCSRNVAAKHVYGKYAIVLLCEGCILSYVQNSCLLAFLQHAQCLALLQYVSCIIPCNTTPCGLRTPLWKACKLYPLRVLFVATMYAVCLILYRYVCLQVLSRQQTGICMSCAKWPCGQVSPCLSSQQVDNPALCRKIIFYKRFICICSKTPI